MRFKHWTIGKKLWALAIFTSINLCISGLFAFQNTVALVSLLELVSQVELPAVKTMGELDMVHDGIRAATYRAILAGEHDPSKIEECQSELTEMSNHIFAHAKTLSGLDLKGEIHKKLKAVDPVLKAYTASAQKIMDGVKAGKMAETVAMISEFNEAFEILERDLEGIGDEIIEESQRVTTQSDQISKSAHLMNLIIMGLGMVIGLSFSYFINRNLVRNLNRIMEGLTTQTENVGASSSAISRSAEGLSTSSHQQASAVQETAASLEEINSMVAKTAENASRLKNSVDESSRSVDGGKTAVGDMLSSMDVISKSNKQVMAEVEESNRQIKEIVQVIAEIGEKTKVINTIVFQTKLLSFNASVEAARAGEHGKGFAVVAEEVGNLAQMSGTAAAEISEMLQKGIERAEQITQASGERMGRILNEGQTKVEHGGQTAKICGESFESIVGQVSEVSAVSEEISTAIAEQSKGLGEINRAIGLFDKTTQENAETAEQASGTAKELLVQFGQLNHLVGELRAIVLGPEKSKKHNSQRMDSSTSAQEPTFRHVA